MSSWDTKSSKVLGLYFSTLFSIFLCTVAPETVKKNISSADSFRSLSRILTVFSYVRCSSDTGNFQRISPKILAVTMNPIPQSPKYQEENYVPRHAKTGQSTKMITSVNKHTNTPGDFMLCSRCKDKVAKKDLPISPGTGDCLRTIAEYSKALNYINSCHTIINQMMSHTKDGNEFIRMPDLPNFMDLFTSFTSNSQISNESSSDNKKGTHSSRYNLQHSGDRSRNNSLDRTNRSPSPKLYHKTQSSENPQSLKPTTKGKYIELLPEVKNLGAKLKKSDTFSPGTTESEESDLELNLSMHKNARGALTSKFKSKIKVSHEKVIYEEDSVEDDTFKKERAEKITQKTTVAKSKLPVERSKAITTSKSRVNTSSSPPMVCNTGMVTDNSRKTKQRSSSTVTPRERQKFGFRKGVMSEVAGNFSDTVITTGSSVGQGKKYGAKSLCTQMDMRNNELSQQELDKYAKELLGSGSASPRSHRSKSPVSTGFRTSVSPEKSKSNPDNQDRNKKFQKPLPLPTLKSQAAEQKRRSSQDKLQTYNNNNGNLNSPPSKGTIASSTNIHQKQEPPTVQQSKRGRKSYSTQYQQQQSLLETNSSGKKQNYRKSGTNNSYSNISHNMTQNASSNKVANYTYANNQTCCNDVYCRGHSDKGKSTQETQEDEEINNKGAESNEDLEDDNCSSPEQLNLLCDNTEMLSMHCRPSAFTTNKFSTSAKVQYSITNKPNDFFTAHRKSNKSGAASSKGEVDYDINMDSDEIKTDSDIEEDHFEKNEAGSLSRKSSKHSGPDVQISQVLSHLGLLPNAQVPPETEQLMKDAKSIRAHDERNRPFREPRKTEEDPEERIVKIEERSGRMRHGYEGENVTPLHRTISEESSDIKSDDDMYGVENAHAQTYSFCHTSGRYQT